jgi:hypothetical protein
MKHIPDVAQYLAAAERGDLDASHAAIWGDTPHTEIEERIERARKGTPVALFADAAQDESGDIPVRIAPDDLTIPAALRSVATRAAFGIWDQPGLLTCNHSASSYGQFVLLVDGVAYGLGDAIYPQGISALLFHPNPGPGWCSANFEAAVKSAQAQGWKLQGESW